MAEDKEEEVVPAEEGTEQTETEETAEQKTEVDETDWKAEAEKKEAAFQDQKKRAEKAEAKLKEQKPAAKSGDELSGKDVLALSTLQISEDEDIDFLKDAAALRKTTVSAITKDSTVMAILKGKQEERQTSVASSTGSGRRTVTERKGSDILATAKADNMPASGKDTRKMVRAALGLKD